MTNSTTLERPTSTPPSPAAAAAKATLTKPAALTAASGAASVPTREHPTSTATASTDAATSWATGTVDALWAIDETRNGWLRITGVGWQKVFNGSDFAYLALMSLGAQARQTGSTINYLQGDDGQIHQLYLW